MFKSKEDVITEIKIKNSKMQCGYTVEIGVGEAFKSIAERIDFYDKYKDTSTEKGHEKLIDDHIDIYKRFIECPLDKKYAKECHGTNEEIYNSWLYRYCFDGVK